MSEASSASTSDRRPRVWTVFLALAAGVGVQIANVLLVVAIGVVVTAGSRGDPARMAAEVQAWASSAPAITLASFVACVGLAAVALVCARLSPEGVAARLRLRAASWAPSAACTGAAIVGLIAFAFALGAAADLLGLAGQGSLAAVHHVIETASTAGLVGLVVSLGASGLPEELLFRGYVQTRLVARWGRPAGIFVTALAFGVYHVDPVHGAIALLLGLYLGVVAERAQSIRPCILAHVTNNVVAVLSGRFLGGNALVFLVAGTAVAAASLALLLRAARLPRADTRRTAPTSWPAP